MPTRTWTGATNNDWNTATNWVEGFIPTNVDDVVFSTNVNCTISSASVCKTITFGSYSGTFTNTGGLTVSGNVTLGSSVNWGTFSSNLAVNATATLTSNGKDIPGLQFSNTITVTLADNWTVTSRLFFTNAVITVTLNSNNIYVSGGTITHSNGCIINGTATINITGNVNWTSGSAFISNPITVNTSGTFTLSNNFNLSNNTLTWIAGTITSTGSATNLVGNVTFTGTGLILNNLTALSNTTLTLSNDITILGNLTSNTSAATFTIDGNTLYVGGGLDTLVNTTVSGTTNIVLNGTGVIRTTASTGNFRINIEINTSGTITFGSNFRYGIGTFKYTSGNTNTTSSNFIAVTTCTIDVNGSINSNGSPTSENNLNFFNFVHNGLFTVTLTTPICVTNLLTISTSSFSGEIVYCQGSLVTTNNTGGGNLILNGSGFISCSAMLRMSTTINTIGKYTFPINFNNTKVFSFNSAILTYIKGNLDTRDVTFLCQATSTLIGVHKLRFRRVVLSNQITMDEFFQGSASQICQVVSNTAGIAYVIVFTNGFQKISNYTSVQDMTLTNSNVVRDSLLLTYSKANRGRNVGNITYINNKPNGIIDYQDTVKSLESMVGVQLQGDPVYN